METRYNIYNYDQEKFTSQGYFYQSSRLLLEEIHSEFNTYLWEFHVKGHM